MIGRREFIIASALAPVGANAQTQQAVWPSKPVRILVGFPPGQGSDVVARILAEGLQKTFGVPFVIENRPGAGGLIAAGVAARATPDGYTILFTSSGPYTISPHLYAKQPFDSMTDLVPVALIGSSPTLLLANPAFPVKTIPEIIKLSMTRELDCGSSGHGITDHLTLEMLKIRSGARLRHVPYKGSAASLTDLVGERIDLAFASSTSALSFVKTGRVEVLAQASSQRWKPMPNVPAIAETYPGFLATSWAMMAVPAGTPDDIKSRLATALDKNLGMPSVAEGLTSSGLEPTPGNTPESAKAFAMAEYEKWGAVIRQANIRLE